MEKNLNSNFSVIHKDYEISYFPQNVQIISATRDRKIYIKNHPNDYVLNRGAWDLLNNCSKDWTKLESLFVCKNLIYKRDKHIKSDLNIKEISPNQLAERLIQAGNKIYSYQEWAILGYSSHTVLVIKKQNIGNNTSKLLVQAHNLSGNPPETYIFINV